MIDCHNHVGVELLTYLRGEFPYCQHLETLVHEGRLLGIDQWVVFPMVSYLALDLGALRKGEIRYGSELEKVPYAFENRRHLHEIYRLFPKEAESVIPFVMIDPNREVPGQVSALRELRGQYPFAGLKLQATIIQSNVKGLFSEGKAFLELAEEWNLPVLIHSSVLKTDIWSQSSDILDLAEANPGLRFCLAHSCRFDREYLDRLAQLPNAWFDCSAHRIHCDLAVQDNPIVAPVMRRFESDYSRPEKVLLDLAEAHPQKLLWGSDSPYYSYVADFEGKPLSLRSSYREEVDCLMALPVDLRRQVAEENTRRFLGNPQ
jgi:predicted TIM-barrel fold metal-dependent hydrolase